MAYGTSRSELESVLRRPCQHVRARLDPKELDGDDLSRTSENSLIVEALASVLERSLDIVRKR